MEWLTCIRNAIRYMEDNLLTIQSAEEVAAHVYTSPLYLQRGFHIMTGFTIGEYIRNRRLYLAALDLVRGTDKVIDIALNYGYETPESFAKAFTRFHGVTPSDVRRTGKGWRTFLPLKITITIQGGEHMNHTIENAAAFPVIGFIRTFRPETSHREIPAFWDEINRTHAARLLAGHAPETPVEQAISRYRIGEYGVCIDDSTADGTFRYMIAGRYTGGDVPEGMTLYTVPAATWAKFRCTGPLPEALQSVTDQIWKEWLPGSADYELSGTCSIEWYSDEGSTDDEDYRSAVWIPVKAK